MNRQRIGLLVILVIAWVGLPAAAQETIAQGRSVSGSECACPKEGHWKVQNLEGWMDCTGPIDFRRKLGEVKDEGTIWVLEEDGVKMVIDVKWVFESEEFLKGEMHSNPSLQGMMCEYYRPFEIRFDEAIQDDEYEKLKKKMEKKLEKIRGRD